MAEAHVSKERLLTQEEPSHAAGIADAIVVKDEDLFFLWEGEGLVFSYDGADGIRRQLEIRFSETPARREGGTVHFEIRLEPHETRRIVLSFSVREYLPTKSETREHKEMVNRTRFPGHFVNVFKLPEPSQEIGA